jgi:hypothetical protein
MDAMAVREHGFHDPIYSLIFFFGTWLGSVSLPEQLFQ